jgi:hypothetical protein
MKKILGDKENRDLEKLSKWLKSDKGRKKIRKAQEAAEKVCETIADAEKIDVETTKIIFGPINHK